MSLSIDYSFGNLSAESQQLKIYFEECFKFYILPAKYAKNYKNNLSFVLFFSVFSRVSRAKKKFSRKT